MSKTRKILLGEGILIIGILIYLFFSTAPGQIYPLHGMTILEPDFNFEIENGEVVMISIDEDFTNPIILKENSDIFLPPGLYYWKVKGIFRESEIKNFTVQENVVLDLKERAENYELQNVGNVDLNVTRENKGVTSDTILNVGESEEVEKDNSSYEGRRIWTEVLNYLFWQV